MTIGILSAESKLANKLINTLATQDALEIIAITDEVKDDAKKLEAAFTDIDTLAFIPDYDQLDAKLVQHMAVIDAAKKAGVKKVVYVSMIGEENKTAIAPVVAIHRKTEELLAQSGLAYVILRSGLYIGAELDYIPEYRKIAKIENCAGTGLCSYTSRTEVAEALLHTITKTDFDGQTLNVAGEGITQTQLADFINDVYGFDLAFENISVEKYSHLRAEALGEKFGRLLAGIHESIKVGDFNVTSDFEKITGHPHKNVLQLITEYKYENSEH